MSDSKFDLDAKTIRDVHNQMVDPVTRKLDRRKFLGLSAMIGAGIALPSLVGCASSDAKSAAPAQAAPKAEAAAAAKAVEAIGLLAGGKLSFAPPLTSPLVMPPSTGKKLRIGNHFVSIMSYWQRYQASFLLRVEELGEEPVTVWTQADLGSWVGGIESVVQQNVDAVVISGLNSEMINPLLPEIRKKNVKIVGMQNDTVGIPVVYQNSFWMSTLSTMYMIERMGGKGNIVMFYTPGLSFNIEHQKAATDAMLKFFPDIKVVDVIAAKFPDAEKGALEDTENLLRREKNLQAVWCCFDMLGVGAVRAIKDAGRQNDIFVVSNGGDDSTLEAMAGGDPVWGFTAWVDYWEIGRRVADTAVALARGGKAPAVSTVYGAGVDKSNAALYKKLIDEQNKLTEETLKRYGKKG